MFWFLGIHVYKYTNIYIYIYNFYIQKVSHIFLWTLWNEMLLHFSWWHKAQTAQRVLVNLVNMKQYTNTIKYIKYAASTTMPKLMPFPEIWLRVVIVSAGGRETDYWWTTLRIYCWILNPHVSCTALWIVTACFFLRKIWIETPHLGNFCQQQPNSANSMDIMVEIVKSKKCLYPGRFASNFPKVPFRKDI